MLVQYVCICVCLSMYIWTVIIQNKICIEMNIIEDFINLLAVFLLDCMHPRMLVSTINCLYFSWKLIVSCRLKLCYNIVTLLFIKILLLLFIKNECYIIACLYDCSHNKFMSFNSYFMLVKINSLVLFIQG